MPSEPQVKPLSRLRRRIFFALLLLFFVVSLPAFIFYATGYRYNPFADVPMIIATGGIYVTKSIPEAQIYVNEERVTNARTFRDATYLSGLEAGVHRVHVQAPGTATWVKELQVLPHIVTEVESFNIPIVPHVRIVTPFTTTAGVPVVVVATTSTVPFQFASTTEPYIATTSRITAALVASREYARVTGLFAEQASTTALRRQLEAEVESANERFGFATTSGIGATTTVLLNAATTTVVVDDLMLYEAGGEVYVRALGTGRDVPVYFCAVSPEALARAEEREILRETASASTTLEEFSEAVEFAPGDLARECRTDIRIDRLGQEVHSFAFMPGDTNLVLMNLTNGLYVVEVDDRAWQNAQLLYPGSNLAVVADSNRIYASSTEGVVEVFTEIPVE